MLDRQSNDVVTNALEDLIIGLGVKEEMAFLDLIALLRKRDTQKCVQEIATRLGLPVRINLSYVAKDFRPGSADRFSSNALVQTDGTGRGIEHITAQVSIPDDLPMFGTSALQDYPIRVRISENCHAHPVSFVAIMAHELAHVLLASLWLPYKDSEIHTDLVPIILGFREAVRRGRKRIASTTKGDTTTTETTTYGYLTDSQFADACNYVTRILDRHSHEKKRLQDAVEQVQRKLTKPTRVLATFRDYFRYLDMHPPDRMKKEHAERLVQLHGRDYGLEWENRITAVGRNMEIAEVFARTLNHYSKGSVEQLKAHIRASEAGSKELDDVTETIAQDESMLRKHVGIVYRLRRTLWRQS